MSDETVYIFVREAVVNSVIGADDFVVIDYDVLESFECPICNETTSAVHGIVNSHNYCYDCNINWDGPPDERTIIAKYKQFAKER